MKRRDFVQSSVWAAAALGIPNFKAVYAGSRPGAVPDIAAVTGDGREVTLRGADIQDLVAKLHGQLLLAGDRGYDDARRAFGSTRTERNADRSICMPRSQVDWPE